MKNLTIEEMETIEGGFAWGSFAAGVGCGLGLLTAETGVGAAVAWACCGLSLVQD